MFPRTHAAATQPEFANVELRRCKWGDSIPNSSAHTCYLVIGSAGDGAAPLKSQLCEALHKRADLDFSDSRARAIIRYRSIFFKVSAAHPLQFTKYAAASARARIIGRYSPRLRNYFDTAQCQAYVVA
jgi:hypothetical protein